MQRTSVMDLRIGSHCTVPGCQQLDFLPFVCTSCHASLCLEHQSFAAHDCPSAPADRRAPDCPKCSRVVALLPNEEPAVALARHIGAGCQVTKTIADGPRCQAAGCRTRHNHTPVKCPHCNGSFCVSHRVAEDHACKRAPTPVVPARPARAVVKPAPKPAVTATASSSEIVAPNMHKDDIFTIRLWLAALPADALPVAQRQRLNVQPILVKLNRRWSVGKAVDWICSQLGVRNDGSTRHRLVSLDQPQVVLNNLVLSQSGRVNDDGTQSPDLGHEAGVALVPESLISSMTQQHLQSLVSEVQSSVAANQSIGRRCANEVQKMLAGMLPTYVTARAQ